ncbi:MAG TPA: glycosyl hydrolase [Caldithrix abyssi]|uniref:Glycosyl hydrolase n=1 Tax=Caldithrix abyssi TaxID=187145 RepID=A0A7V4WUS3_CALAY|nr:glycosyl hydrolase [Caldithrix abyssi]
MRIILMLLLTLSFTLTASFSQTASGKADSTMDTAPLPSPAKQRLQAFEQRQKLQRESLVANVSFRSVGPTVMSGRVVDIEANPDDPTEFYVAYASGGLWHTTNNGVSFEPLFDRQAVMTIGDIAVDWRHGGTVWVGTGENNSSRSSYSGTGLYKSEDGGKTWQFTGLPETQHIGRILIHPDDENILWVAALGHLYSSNPERGVYKTTDGGTTWKRVLFADDNSGAVDLAIDPSNPDILYAALWERSRRAWNFVESGPHSGIYKSTDGGESWQLLTNEKSGFPTGDGVGRIGITVAPSDPNIVFALLDNQFRREKEEEEYAVTKDLLRSISVKDFLKLDADDLNDFLDRNNFPMEFNADTLFQLVKKGTIKPVTLVEYLEDANAQLFDTPVIGAELYRSEDGGKTWQRTHKDYLDKVVYTFGYYFGQVRVDWQNPDRVYLLGVPILKSEDGGKTFVSINGDNVHVDHHALWLSPKRSGHIICGNDGGVNISYDDGKHWLKANTPAVGQFYTVAVDMDKPYNVYGGLQDNGVWVGPSTYKSGTRWTASGRYPYKSIMGGDGMQVAVDTRDNTTVYTGFQFGNYFRVNRQGGKPERITPCHKLGERPLRFNWQTPIHLSVHNQDILYFGSQKLHRSLNKGKDWETISGDLTKGGKKGDVPYGTLTTIHESPLKFGLIYTGSDDGLIYVTRDGGNSWQRISDNLPQNLWVSRVQASAHDTATVYATLNGYRWDHFDAYVYKSTDYGQNWQRIGTDLPAEPVNVIREDPHNAQILYVGTDHGLYVTLDGGAHFMGLSNGLPDAPVHDLVIQPRERDLVVATHGRSLYIADVAQLEQLTPEMLQKPLYVFPLKEITYSASWGNRNYAWNFNKAPEIQIVFYSAQKGKAVIKIYGKDDYLLHDVVDQAERGLNYVPYDLSVSIDTFKDYWDSIDKVQKEIDKIKTADDGRCYLRPGEYKIEITTAGKKQSRTFTIKEAKKKQRKKKKKTP